MKSAGSILSSALFFITLTLTIFTVLTEIILRQITLTEAQIIKQKDLTLAQNQLSQELIQNPTLYTTINSNLHFFENLSLPSSLLIISSTNQSHRSLLLSKRSSLDNFPFLNWATLEKNLPTFPCDKRQQTTSKNILSNQSCIKLSIPLTQSTYLKGNLTLNDSLTIQASNANLYLVATGSIILSQPIQILNSSNLKLIILAPGNIHLNTIQSNSSTNISLQIYSATKSIKIDSLNNQLNFCQDDPSSNPNFISTSLQALAGFQLEKSKLQNISIYGCPVEYELKYWPKNLILGELSR